MIIALPGENSSMSKIHACLKISVSNGPVIFKFELGGWVQTMAIFAY